MNTPSRPIDLPDVAACLYEAGANPAYWPEAAILVRKYTLASTSNLMWVDRTGRKLIWYADGLSQDTQAIYASGLYKSDPAYRFALNAALDNPGIDDDFGPREEYEQSAVYDLLKREGIAARARSVVLRSARQIAFIGLGRREFQGPFDAEALWRLREVSPHLRRAIQVAYRLRTAEHSVRPLMEVMDRLEHGVYLVNQAFHVTYVNAAGSRLLRESGALTLRQRTLKAKTPQESAALVQLLQGAIQTAKGEGRGSGGWLTLHDAYGRVRLFLDITPLRIGTAISDKAGASPWAMIVARMPDMHVPLRPEALRERFQLSPAEATLAVDLAQGAPLKDIAERRGVAFGTVRAQLASIFEKTGVHRQSELVKLLTAVSSGLVEQRRGSRIRKIPPSAN